MHKSARNGCGVVKSARVCAASIRGKLCKWDTFVCIPKRPAEVISASTCKDCVRKGSSWVRGKPNKDKYCKEGVPAEQYCCAKSCGECGGDGCEGRKGGKSGCCKEHIEMAGKYCEDGNKPPCLMRGKWEMSCVSKPDTTQAKTAVTKEKDCDTKKDPDGEDCPFESCLLYTSPSPRD